MTDDEDDVSLNSFSDGEDELKDIELMNDIMHSIAKFEKPSTGSTKQALNEIEVPKNSLKAVSLDDLTLIELQIMLNQVSQALEANNNLQSTLLMKEVKLLSLKRMVAPLETCGHKWKKEAEMKCDIGRYMVKFKAPYFKNGSNFSSYTIVPEKSLPFSSLKYEHKAALQWTKMDLVNLEKSVQTFLSKRAIGLMLKTIVPKTIESKLKLLEKFEDLKQASLSSLITEDFDQIIDWCHIASRLKKNHSPNECQKAWDMFLSPSLNKSKWGVNEKKTLQKLALEHNFEDWDTIAEKLGTNRTGYQCFNQYVDAMTKLSEGEWSKAEEDFLTNLVKECTYGHKILWHKVSYFFESRTLNQLYRKWKLSSVGKDNKAGVFTEEDDKFIIDTLLVKKGDVHRVAQRLNRLSSQVRYRLGQLKNSLTHKYGEFSLEEDKKLMELVQKYGTKSWAKISEYMPDRGRVQIRHRYKHIKKMQKAYPDITLEDFSRTRRPVHMGRKQVNLKYVKSLNTEVPGENREIEGDTNEEEEDNPKEPTTAEYEDPKSSVATLLGNMVLSSGTSDDACSSKTNTAMRQSKITFMKPGVKKPKKLTRGKPKQIKSLKSDLPSELNPKLIDFYGSTTEFIGNPIKPTDSYEGGFDTEITNALLKFRPYKYFEKRNTDWYFNADRTDPYYNEVLKVVECVDKEKKEDDSKDGKEWLFPPNLTSLEGFHNLLIDLGYSQEDLELSDEDLEHQLKRLYCAEDEETLAAVSRWKQRLKSLFLWPIVLSNIELSNDAEEASGHETEGNLQALNESERIQLAEELNQIADDDLRAIMVEQLGLMNDNANRLSTLALQDETPAQIKSEPVDAAGTSAES